MNTANDVKAAQLTILRNLAAQNPTHAEEITSAIEIFDAGAVTYLNVRAILKSTLGI